MAATPERPLKILHVFRAPIGGLFRHVLDLARGQAERGHQVGFVLDSLTGGARAEETLAALAPRLALGMLRLPMSRQIGLSDFGAVRKVSERIDATQPDVVHGHGAKGAAYGRLARAAPRAIRAYTPHGGSLVYRPGTLSGFVYRRLEKLLIARTDLFLFESAYALRTFEAGVSRPRGTVRVVCNGVGEGEFAPVVIDPDATDIVFIGELRPVKGVDLLIDALAELRAQGRPVTATIVGDGPDRGSLTERVQRAGLAEAIRFAGAMPARRAFACGRLMLVPSRAESLPYVVLEAAAAGLPIVATDVGGVADIFGAEAHRLIPSENRAALVGAIAAALDDPSDLAASAQRVRARVRSEFSLKQMIDGAIAAYADARRDKEHAESSRQSGK